MKAHLETSNLFWHNHVMLWKVTVGLTFKRFLLPNLVVIIKGPKNHHHSVTWRFESCLKARHDMILLSNTTLSQFEHSGPHVICPLPTSPAFCLIIHSLFSLCSAVDFVVSLLPTEDPPMGFLLPRMSFKHSTPTFQYLQLCNSYSSITFMDLEHVA